MLLCSPVCIYGIDVGQHEEGVSCKLLCKQTGGTILVDHCLDAFKIVIDVADNGDAAASGANNHDALINQQPDRLDLGDAT